MPRPTLDDLSRKVSASVRSLNPQLFGADIPHKPGSVGVGRVDPAQHGQPARALGQGARPQRSRPAGVASGSSVVVCLCAHLHGHPLDTDNLAGAMKPLRDALAAWLGLDDGDPRVHWRYTQVQTAGPEGTTVAVWNKKVQPRLGELPGASSEEKP